MFLNQLISSQLDMDRLDYLKRDSFYTGVSEGNINSDRLIAMLNVKDDVLVIEEKGIYSVEKFIVSRRLMYWQVYLHKTGLVAEKILVKTLQRAKELVEKGMKLRASSALTYFLQNQITINNFTDETLEIFSRLDDYDVLSAIKEWTDCDDRILASLSKMLVDRKLWYVKIQNNSFDTGNLATTKKEVQNDLQLTDEEMNYFFIQNTVSNQAYSEVDNQIQILYKDDSVKNIVEASDHLNIQTLSKPVVKHFVCFPKAKF